MFFYFCLSEGGFLLEKISGGNCLFALLRQILL